MGLVESKFVSPWGNRVRVELFRQNEPGDMFSRMRACEARMVPRRLTCRGSDRRGLTPSAAAFAAEAMACLAAVFVALASSAVTFAARAMASLAAAGSSPCPEFNPLTRSPPCRLGRGWKGYPVGPRDYLRYRVDPLTPSEGMPTLRAA
jgi:hypothetical protein